MLRKTLVLILLLLCCTPTGVFAQQANTFSQVKVALWPEFDRPTMLVIYHITLSPQTTLPAAIRLRIPASAGAPNAVAARQPDGSLINIPYKKSEAGEWSWIEFQATTPELQIEYYDPGLTKNGQARHYEYIWPGDYAVDAFTVEVQQPVGASEMIIKPLMVSTETGQDGMTYHRMDVGSLEEGRTFQITVDYNKSDDQLSSDNVPVEPSGPLDTAASGRMSMTTALPWLLGGLGLLLIAGGGLWYWHSGRGQAQPKKEVHPRRRATERSESSSERPEGGAIYCHNCGKRASPGDRFCRACGTQLRLGG
jgi:hypothetical protein